MHASLVGKGGAAYKGGPWVVMKVRQFVDKTGKLGKFPEIPFGQDFFSYLEFENGKEGGEIAIPGAFSVAVHCSLDLEGTLLHCGDGIGHAESAIVVGVDPDLGPGKAGSDGADDGGDFRWKAASIRVAENEVIGSRLGGGFQRAKGVIVIGGVPVKKVFRVVDNFPALFLQKSNGIGDHAEIFDGGGTENFLHVKKPAFSEDGNDGRFGLEEKADLGVVGGFDVRSASGAEGSKFTGAPTEFSGFGKKIPILVVGTGPTALHVVKSVGCEPFGEAEFVGKGEVDAFALGTIAKGGVVDGEMGAGGHGERG
jgi:hypothetical protein